MNCLYSLSSCNRNDAAVICGGDLAGTKIIQITILLHYAHTTDSCPHNGSIHLVGPSGPNTVEGRVPGVL